MRRLIPVALLLSGLVAGALGATVTSASAARLTSPDAVGDAVIHRADGTIEHGVRSDADIRRIEIVAGRYRTRIQVTMSDVTRAFRSNLTFRTRLEGADGTRYFASIRLERGGWSASVNGDVGWHDCAVPRFGVSPDDDTLTLSVLNDCVGNATSVRGSMAVRYAFSERGRVSDRARAPFVRY